MDLGGELKKVDIEKVTFATVPVLDNPRPATVILNKTRRTRCSRWCADDALAERGQEGQGQEVGAGQGPRPREVRVDVTNGGGPIGAAQETVDWLQNNKGCQALHQRGNAPAKLAETTLEYAPKPGRPGRHPGRLDGAARDAR